MCRQNCIISSPLPHVDGLKPIFSIPVNMFSIPKMQLLVLLPCSRGLMCETHSAVESISSKSPSTELHYRDAPAPRWPGPRSEQGKHVTCSPPAVVSADFIPSGNHCKINWSHADTNKW